MADAKRHFLLATEDWLSVWIGLLIFVLAMGPLVGLDLLGWAVKPEMWTSLLKVLKPVSKNYADLPGVLSLVLTYLAFLVVMGVGAKALGAKMGKFIYGFTVIFCLTFGCVVVGHFAYLAVNAPEDLKKFDIGWSLKLTGEAGLIVSLLAGLFVSNFMPRFAESLVEVTTPAFRSQVARASKLSEGPALTRRMASSGESVAVVAGAPTGSSK